MADDPECFGNYNKIDSGERADNDCTRCPVLIDCANVIAPAAPICCGEEMEEEWAGDDGSVYGCAGCGDVQIIPPNA